MPLSISHLTLLYLTSLISPSLTISNVLRQSVTIDLSRPDEDNRTQTVFTVKINLSQGDVIVDIANATADAGFYVIQAHSFQHNVTLSKTDNFTIDSFVIGTNIGLVEYPLSKNAVYRYYLNYVETPTVEVLLAVVVYKPSDPIPGGCNMVFNTKYAPYQLVGYDENMITVDAAPAKASSCNVLRFPRVDMYHLFLDEETLDSNSYFNALQSFLTVSQIMKYGTKVSDSVKHLPLRRYYAAYKGTGTLFAIIATYQFGSSAYVPSVSYACDVNNWDESCLGPVTITWKLLCATILFVGAFICHFGHRFFRFTLFVFGLIFGSFIFYVAINIANTTTMEQGMGYALLFGCAYGICWVILWCRYGIPILSVSLPVLFVGYIASCVIFHMGVGDMHIFHIDMNYWSIVLCITIPLAILLLLITEFANILACSVMGATAMIMAIDHYAGGSIHYIILNNFRRAVVPNFNQAILDPPFQYKDIILSIAWIGLVVFGIIVQRKQQIGKPPFPPHRSSPRNSWERTPLLASVRNASIETGRAPLLASVRNVSIGTGRTPLLPGESINENAQQT